MLTISSAIGHGSIFGMGLAALLWKILDSRFAGPEEEGLRSVFGEAAEGYFEQTRRWL
jgi:protein-S-isoprenylcysteine O-methyltransferase Ste14